RIILPRLPRTSSMWVRIRAAGRWDRAAGLDLGSRTSYPIRSGRSAIRGHSTAMILDQINYEHLLVPFNKFYDLHTGGSRRPIFHDIATTRPELLALDRNFAIIREELLGVLPEKRSIPRYHELDRMQYPISGLVDQDKDWKVFPLNIMGVKPRAYCERCPR